MGIANETNLLVPIWSCRSWRGTCLDFSPCVLPMFWLPRLQVLLVVVLTAATMGFSEPNPTSGVNRRRHCGLVSELQEFETRMSESDLNTYKLQLQQVEAALTTDPENEVRRSSLNVQTFQMATDMSDLFTLCFFRSFSSWKQIWSKCLHSLKTS